MNLLKQIFKKTTAIVIAFIMAFGFISVAKPRYNVKAAFEAKHYDLTKNGGSWDGTKYTLNGEVIKDAFFTDGTYTYFLQADGTAMKDRLTYHPDGIHVIYFDENGHEVFSNFSHVKKSISGDSVDDLCFFDVYGYMYVNFLTFNQDGTALYYANPYGVMECTGWFQFAGDAGYVAEAFGINEGTWAYAYSDGKIDLASIGNESVKNTYIPNQENNKKNGSDLNDYSAKIGAYKSILNDIIYNGRLVYKGESLTYQPIEKDYSSNEFALCDIDNDGKDELLISITSTSIAEMQIVVFDYSDEKQLYMELDVFPDVVLYGNYIQANASHNQGPDGDFWPYSLWKYDEKEDIYNYYGFAIAWEGNYMETYYNETFPAEYDKNGNKLIYYLTDTELGYDDKIVDDDEYISWRAKYIDENMRIEPDWYVINEDNMIKVFGE